MCASACSAGTDAFQVVALVLERLAAEHAPDDLDRIAHRAERLVRLHPRVVEEDLRGPEAEDEPARPAASCTTRASIATCTGWRVNGEMIPQPIVSRFVSRAISADTTVDERASMPCLRHHG